jgi:small subunit ribosomal protein S4
MGDPKRSKKSYAKPRHPWQAERIEEEKKIVKKHGLKNKKELWKCQTMLRNFRRQARKSMALGTAQAEKEEKQLLDKLERLNLLKNPTPDGVLALQINDILERRLQTRVYKKGLANTVSQARQYIVHGHISVRGSKITSPGHLVKRDEEETIQFSAHTKIKAENSSRSDSSSLDEQPKKKKNEGKKEKKDGGNK